MNLTAVVLGDLEEEYYETLVNSDITCINRNSAFREIIIAIDDNEYNQSIIRVMFVSKNNDSFLKSVISRSNVCLYPVNESSILNYEVITEKILKTFTSILGSDEIILPLICPVITKSEKSEMNDDKQESSANGENNNNNNNNNNNERGKNIREVIKEKMNIDMDHEFDEKSLNEKCNLYYKIPELEGIVIDRDIENLKKIIISASSFDLGEFFSPIDNDGAGAHSSDTSRCTLSQTGKACIRFLWKLNEDKMKDVLNISTLEEAFNKASDMRNEPGRTIIRGIMISNFERNYLPKREILLSFLNIVNSKEIRHGLYIRPTSLYKEKLKYLIEKYIEKTPVEIKDKQFTKNEIIKRLFIDIFDTLPPKLISQLIDYAPLYGEEENTNTNMNNININKIIDYTVPLGIIEPMIMLTTSSSLIEKNIMEESRTLFDVIPKVWLPGSDHKIERNIMVIYNATDLKYPKIYLTEDVSFLFREVKESIAELFTIHPLPDVILSNEEDAMNILKLASAMGVMVVVVSEKSRDAMKLETGMVAVKPDLKDLSESLKPFFQYHTYNGIIGQQKLLSKISEKKQDISKSVRRLKSEDVNISVNKGETREYEKDSKNIIKITEDKHGGAVKKNKPLILFGIAMITMIGISIGSMISGSRKPRRKK